MFSKLAKLLGKQSAGPVWTGGPSDFVAELDADMRICRVSDSAGDIVGADTKSLIWRSLYDFIRREDREAVNLAFHAALGDDKSGSARTRADFRLLRPCRAPAHAEASFMQTRPGRVLALIRNRDEDLARERELRASAEAANGEAAARRDLMADLAHEMKTPLNAIMGFADAMRTETFGPLGHEKYEEYADLIHASGGHLMDLIGSVLDFSKIEADRYALNPALIAPGDIARECAEMIRQGAEEAGLKLVIDIDDDLPETFLDPRAVRQILLNLLSNAVKFTSDGEISVKAVEGLGSIEFTISDTGVGMSETELAKLGGRYTDVHEKGVRGTSGSGLGLSLAFALAELMGGFLQLNSAPGEGVVAHLTLPVVTAASRQKPAGKEPTKPGAVSGDDVQSQLDRVAQFRRERTDNTASAA